MSLRDLFVISVVLLLLPISFRRPFVGLLLFSWLAYMRPQDLCWGLARTMRFSFLVAATMLVGWFVNESHKRPFVRWELRSVLMIALGVLVSISLGFAGRYSEATPRYFAEFLKILVIALFTLSQVDSKQRLRALLWVICASLAFYAVKNGLIGVLKGGGLVILRGPGGMLEDNNDFALALVMNVPLLFYLPQLEADKRLRWACLIAILLTAVTVLLTHSRGGFLSMCFALLWIAMRSGKLLQAGLAVVTGVMSFFAFAPAHVVERVMSIFVTQENADSSIQSRFDSWALAFRMWQDNPLWGVGLRNFQLAAKQDYGRIQDEQNIIHVAHNSYLQIAAEGGGLAFLVYLSLLVSVFVSCSFMRRAARMRADMKWAGVYGRMFEATTVAFLCGSTFLNRGHFDLIYHFFSIVAAATLVTRAQLRRAPHEVMAEQQARGGGVRVRLRPGTEGVLQPRWGR